jgi:glycerol-3-phosphate acyltransferase PlsX
MGEVLAKALLKKTTPTVGLLNVGSEEMKGNAVVQSTGQALHLIDKTTQNDASLERFMFHGFVEGNDIFKGVTDVIVTDGFSGNIALKAIEGSILFFFELIKKSAKQSWWNKLVALLMLPILKNVSKTIDPRLYNGAVFLGLKKIAVKSHGSADAFSFAKAVCVAVNMVQSNFADDIEKRLQLIAKIQ